MEDRRHVRSAKNDHAGSGSPRRPWVAPTGERPDRPRDPLPTRLEELPDLPAAFDANLASGLAALRLQLEPDQRRAIEDHVRVLLAWNDSINLTAIRDPGEIALRHVVDSLTAVALLRERRVERLVDVGSGGGFPGLPLAAAVPLRRALLVESVGKKAAFLGTAVRVTGFGGRVEIASQRAEALAARPEQRAAWPAVTARAVGPLGELIELAFPLLALGGFLVAWKRGDIETELDAGRRALEALGGGRLEIVPVGLPALANHCLVVATRSGPIGAEFPRDPRVRNREPW